MLCNDVVFFNRLAIHKYCDEFPVYKFEFPYPDTIQMSYLSELLGVTTRHTMFIAELAGPINRKKEDISCGGDGYWKTRGFHD